MPTVSSTKTSAITHEDIWALADTNNFEAVISALLQTGVKQASMGEALFCAAREAIAQERFNSGRLILQFLIESLADKTEAPPLFKIVGDLYRLEKNLVKAREYYQKLPTEPDNIHLFLRSFNLESEFPQLLEARNQFLIQTPANCHQRIHAIVDEIVTSFIESRPELMAAHKKRYQKNLERLKHFSPRIATDIPAEYSIEMQPCAVQINNKFYGRHNGIWFPITPRPDTGLKADSLKRDENILIRCPGAASLLDLMASLAAIDPKFYRYECLVVLDVTIIAEIMAVGDISDLMNQEARVIRIVNENKLEEELETILERDKSFFPATMVNNSGQNGPYYNQILRPLLQRFEQKILNKIRESKNKIASLYPPDFHKKVIKKIKKGKKLRILFCSSRYTTYTQYSIRDIAEGFCQLGHKVFIEQEKEGAGYGIRTDVALDNLCRFRPDIIFTIDHLRYEKDYIPKSIPFVTWVQDMLPNIYSIDDPGLITTQDYIFSFSKRWAEHDLKKYNAYKHKKIRILPVSVSSDIYKPLPDIEKIYDVTSVTHLCKPESTLYPYASCKLKSFSLSEQMAIKQLVEKLETLSLPQLRSLQMYPDERKKIMEDICVNNHIPITTKLKKITAWTGKNKESTPFRNHIILLMKIRPVSHLLRHGVKVKAFGYNWDQYPSVKKAAMGEIENGEELNRLFNQSHINLNTSPGTTYHMKVPEVIASNNFLLTARIPSFYDCMPIEDFYEKDTEIILFNDEKDLITKVIFYLDNPDKRDEITYSAYKKHITKYTNKANTKHILNSIKHQ